LAAYAFWVTYIVISLDTAFRFQDGGNTSMITKPWGYNDNCKIIFDPKGDHGKDCNTVYEELSVKWYCVPEDSTVFNWKCNNDSFPTSVTLTKDCGTEEPEDTILVATFDSYDNETEGADQNETARRGPGYYVIKSPQAGVWAVWTFEDGLGDLIGGVANVLKFLAAAVVSCCWWYGALTSCCVACIVCLVSNPPIDPSAQQAVQMTYMAQPGMMQPGMMQPGMMQPGMMQPGMQQPGMMQPGMMQPGMQQQAV